MAYVPDASQTEIENGGRTVEEILEDMKQESARNPGPVKKFMQKAGQTAISTAKSNLKSAARQYFGMLRDAAEESGVEQEDMDVLMADAFTDTVDTLTDEVADVTVNGMTPEERMKTEELQKDNTKEEPTKTTYAPDEKDNIRMALAEKEAQSEGKTVKKLQYTDKHLETMSPEGITMAGRSNLASMDQMTKLGLDVTDVLKNAGKNFGVTAAALTEVMQVPKVKVLPELAPHTEFGLESTGVVSSAEDMANLGDDEFFTRQAESKQSIMQEVANVTVGVGEKAMSAAELGKARGDLADSELNINAIERNRQMQLEESGGLNFGQ